jgi:hypothetical protein
VLLGAFALTSFSKERRVRKLQLERVLGITAIGCAWLVLGTAAGHAEGVHAVPAPKAASGPLSRSVAHDDPLIDPVSELGQRARGLYFSAPAYARLGAQGIISRLRASKLNAAVLDFKDGEGRVTYDTKIPSLQPQKDIYVKDLRGFVAELKAAGIYTIARVVCFSDPFLPRNEPDRAIMDNRPYKKGKIWASWGKRNTWLDPYNTRNHDLILEMAKEVEAHGVDEIQFDYIRWPVDSTVRWAHFPAQVETPRRYVLIGMLKRIDEALRIPISADVFGLTTFHEGDPAGLGQSLGEWTPYVEVFSPMLYLNGMQALVPKGEPQRAQRLIYRGIKTLRNRVGPKPVLRPFIQAFQNGADYYNPEFIAEQIRGAYSAGGDGFLFWHPGSNYRMVQAGMVGPARGMGPLQFESRMAARKRAWDKEQHGAREDDAEPERKRGALHERPLRRAGHGAQAANERQNRGSSGRVTASQKAR